MKISGITYMPHRKRRRSPLSTMLIILVTLILFTIAFLTILVGWNLTHPAHTFADKLINKTDFNNITDVSFTDTQKKVTLSGWLFKSATPQKLLILSHGYGDSRMIFGEKTSELLKAALERDYNVLTFDYRGHGTSDNTATTIGYYEKNDLAAAINYAKSLGFPHIFILGHSMGGATASLTVSENPGIVDALIIDSSFADLNEYLYANLPVWSGLPKFPFSYTIIPFCSLITGLNPTDVSPVKALEKVPAEKIMLIHSKDDNKVPYSDSQRLFKAADSAAVYWTVEKAPHGKVFNTYTNDYIEKLFAFTEKRFETTIRESQQTTEVGNPLPTPIPQLTITPQSITTTKPNIQVNTTKNTQNTTKPGISITPAPKTDELVSPTPTITNTTPSPNPVSETQTPNETSSPSPE